MSSGPLTTRQLRIVDMLARGVTQKEIASLLYENYDSFRRHLMHIRAEALASTNEQLVAICYERGWLPLNSNPDR